MSQNAWKKSCEQTRILYSKVFDAQGMWERRVRCTAALWARELCHWRGSTSPPERTFTTTAENYKLKEEKKTLNHLTEKNGDSQVPAVVEDHCSSQRWVSLVWVFNCIDLCCRLCFLMWCHVTLIKIYIFYV